MFDNFFASSIGLCQLFQFWTDLDEIFWNCSNNKLWDDTVSKNHGEICYYHPRAGPPKLTILEQKINSPFYKQKILNDYAIKWRPKLFWTFLSKGWENIEGWPQRIPRKYKKMWLFSNIISTLQYTLMSPDCTILKYYFSTIQTTINASYWNYWKRIWFI